MTDNEWSRHQQEESNIARDDLFAHLDRFAPLVTESNELHPLSPPQPIHETLRNHRRD